MVRGVTSDAVQNAAAIGQLVLGLASWACCLWLARSNCTLRTALAAQRKLTGQMRTPALTMVLPAVHAPRDGLPRFRLTHLDGRVDPDGVARPPGLPISLKG